MHYITFNPGGQENTFQSPQSFSQDRYAAISPKGVPLVKTKQLCIDRVWIKKIG